MSGFVYIWRDRARDMFYIGSHWGTPDDGYVCSSRWMKAAYENRPGDFKRRIVSWVETSRKDLLKEEERWLQMTKEAELKIKYYNLRRTTSWDFDEGKMASAHERISMKLKGRPSYERTEETRRKMSESSRRLQAEGKIGMRGKRHSDETLEKMSAAQSGDNNPMSGRRHTDEARRKIAEAGRGRVVSEDTRQRLRGAAKEHDLTAFIAAGNTLEVISKRAEKLRGQKRTPEQRQRMREARLRYLESKTA